jgi:hypothetical protein
LRRFNNGLPMYRLTTKQNSPETMKNAVQLPRVSNAGRPVPSQARTTCGLIPKGAKNVEVAKEFLKYLIEPNVVNEYLKVGLGRNVPCMPSIVKRDPWWLADPHRKAYTTQALLGPTIADYWAFNPAYAQVQNEHVWPTGWADIMTGGMTPQALSSTSPTDGLPGWSGRRVSLPRARRRAYGDIRLRAAGPTPTNFWRCSRGCVNPPHGAARHTNGTLDHSRTRKRDLGSFAT